MMSGRGFFPIHLCVDLLHVYENSGWVLSHFRQYRIYFCLPVTSSILPFVISQDPGTFHLWCWSLTYLQSPDSNSFNSISAPLHLTPIGPADAHLRRHAPSSPLSSR